MAKNTIEYIVRTDGDGFLADTVNLPCNFVIYGFDDTEEKAVEMLRRDLDMMYDDLIKDADDKLSKKIKEVKYFLIGAKKKKGWRLKRVSNNKK